MTDRNESTRRAQLRSLNGARNLGLEWDSNDIEMLIEFADVSAEELAQTLSRSVYAVQSARERLANNAIGNGNNANAIAKTQRAWTFIDGDVPPGDW